MTLVWALLYHDVWDVATDDDPPEDVSIQAIYATAAAAEQGRTGLARAATGHDYYTIEPHEILP